MVRRPPRVIITYTLLPYPTLFRSRAGEDIAVDGRAVDVGVVFHREAAVAVGPDIVAADDHIPMAGDGILEIDGRMLDAGKRAVIDDYGEARAGIAEPQSGGRDGHQDRADRKSKRIHSSHKGATRSP